MAKVNVLLKSIFDDGKSLKQPGETISLDSEQANNLAVLGMVEIVDKNKSKTSKIPEAENTKSGSQNIGDTDDDNMEKDNTENL